MASNMNEKVIIITGAAGGIGKATVKAFADLGAYVTLADLRLDDVEKTAKELRLDPERYLACGCDVSSSSQVNACVRATFERWGRIDVLFSNAGISSRSKLLVDLTDADIDNNIDVCLKGNFYFFRAVLPFMIAQRSGSIIATSSVGALRSHELMAEYSASKAGIIGLVHAAAVENAKHNIRVNAIYPGGIQTNMIAPFEFVNGITDENREEKLRKLIPVGRYGQPEDIAELVLFLASEASRNITGEAIRCDGGEYLF
jgi:NAD(P)-dependent dehydrogenase (short-subunit alcohol dehydrogenase family)